METMRDATQPSTLKPDTEPRGHASADLLWIGLVLFVILLIAFLLPIPPNDYWWYVRFGQDTVRDGAIPRVDTLSYTQAGRPVIAHAWLSAVIYGVLDEAGGATLTVLVHGLVLASFYFFLWLACRRVGAGPKAAALATLLAALAGSNNWAVRPQIFAYPLYGVALWALCCWRQRQNNRLWLLPLATALWFNLHPSFVLIFLIVGAALVFGEGDRRALLWTLGAMVLASWVNPDGPLGWVNAFVPLRYQNFGTEWYPPVNSGWQMNLFFGWILIFAPLLALSGKRVSRMHWSWFLGLGWLALSGERYVIWFLAILAILSAELLASKIGARLDRPVVRTFPALNLALVGLLLVMPLAVLPGVRQRWWADAPPVLTPNTPVAAAQWLAQHPELPGPLWSDYIFSSYLTYALPERPVWIDTRFFPFPPEQWERYLAISDARPGWEDMLTEEGAALLLIDVKGQSRLLDALEHSPGWREIYRDTVAAIFVREDAGGSAP